MSHPLQKILTVLIICSATTSYAEEHGANCFKKHDVFHSLTGRGNLVEEAKQLREEFASFRQLEASYKKLEAVEIDPDHRYEQAFNVKISRDTLLEELARSESNLGFHTALFGEKVRKIAPEIVLPRNGEKLNLSQAQNIVDYMLKDEFARPGRDFYVTSECLD